MKASYTSLRAGAAALVISTLIGGSAFAADVISEEPPAPAAPMEMPPVNTWAGPYAGVTVGYGFNGSADSAFGDPDRDGMVFGGFAGWNFQNGALVYGAEADIGYSDVDGGVTGLAARSGLDGSLRARLGYAMTDQILLYGTGGVAAQEMNIYTSGVKSEETMVGWTAGAGVDALLTENIFARAEYRYTDFGSTDFRTSAGNTNVDATDHRINLGIGFKF